MSAPFSSPESWRFSANGHAPEAVHVYRDEAGEAVAVAARFAPGTLHPEKKQFRVYRHEGGEWISGLNGVQLPLYNLPELVAAIGSGKTIYIPEGENSADVLTGWGLASTTNAFGAGSWDRRFADVFTGAHVVVMPDSDPVGRRHAEEVADSLNGVAASVRHLELPGLPDGGDVVDWKRSGGTVEALVDLAEKAPLWTPRVSALDEWPEPVPFVVPTSPDRFPLACALTPVLGELANAIAESVRVDVAAPAAFIPAAISAAVGNAYSIQVSKGYCEPNLSRYSIWCKPSGERGSETFRRLVAPLDDWIAKAEPDYVEKRKSAEADALFFRKRAEGLEAKAGKCKHSSEVENLRGEARAARLRIPSMPMRPVLYIGDVTSPALVRLMDECGGGSAVFSGDARQVADAILGQHRQDKSTDDSVFLRAHGGDPVDRARVGNGTDGELRRIKQPSLAMAICLQPDKFETLADRRDLIDSGFLPRCNLVQPRSLVGERIETGEEEPMDHSLVEEWRDILGAIIDERFRITGGGPGWIPAQLILSAEAMALRREFANQIEKRQADGCDLAFVRAFASKCAGEAARVAGLFHLAILAGEGRLMGASSIPISAETWMAAETLQRWQFAETLRVLLVARQDSNARAGQRILAWVKERPVERAILTTRDVLPLHLGGDKKGAEAILDWLAERGWTRRIEPGEGKRAPRWLVHPKALAMSES